MEFAFSGGKFVSSHGELNYKEVLADFPNAEIIRILTYNISKKQENDVLMDALKNAKADVQLITHVPSRTDNYYNTDCGRRMRSAARFNIQKYILKLNPYNFHEQFTPFFNFHNHAKIIGTENIVYIGSANYSNESANNIETGVIIKDRDFIKKLYEEFFDELRKKSISYFDENFSAFRLFILSLYEKFKHHHRKMLTDLYTDYERTSIVVADTVLMDINDLYALYQDLDDIESVCGAADDTYDEKNQSYNDDLEQLKKRFNSLDTDWLKKIISEDGTLYRLVAFDVAKKTDYILQTEYATEAYDEQLLNKYAQTAVNSAAEMYSALHYGFEEESDTFLEEIKNILSALESAIKFTDKWKASKINPEIDNT